jgi:hypothetical protein
MVMMRLVEFFSHTHTHIYIYDIMWPDHKDRSETLLFSWMTLFDIGARSLFLYDF